MLTDNKHLNTGTVLGLFNAEDRKGRYVYYGIREHGMAAAMNGLALHGGLKPYGGTFMCFTDYARGAMRLSSLMGVPVTYVMTHDSIGLGEDGPTHQPVEHLAMLRATPNVNVFRPCDTAGNRRGVGTGVDKALGTPSVLALTRQNLPTYRTEHKVKEPDCPRRLCAGQMRDGKRQAILMATGSRSGKSQWKRATLLQAEGDRHTRCVLPLLGGSSKSNPKPIAAKFLPAGPVPRGWAVEARHSALAGTAGCFGERGPAREIKALSACMISAHPHPHQTALQGIGPSRQRPWQTRSNHLLLSLRGGKTRASAPPALGINLKGRPERPPFFPFGNKSAFATLPPRSRSALQSRRPFSQLARQYVRPSAHCSACGFACPPDTPCRTQPPPPVKPTSVISASPGPFTTQPIIDRLIGVLICASRSSRTVTVLITSNPCRAQDGQEIDVDTAMPQTQRFQNLIADLHFLDRISRQ